MDDEWDKYTISDQTQPQQDEWSQYAVQPTTQVSNKPNVGSLLLQGAGAVGALGLGFPIAYGAGKVIQGGANIVKNIPAAISSNYGTGYKARDYANQVREAFVKAHTDKTTAFGDQLDQLSSKSPDTKVSLQNMVDDIKSNWGTMPNEAKSVFNRTPLLKDMLKDTNPLSAEISLKDSQNILNHLNTKIPTKIKFTNLDVLEAKNNLRGAQLEAFPQMKNVKADYAKFIEPYNRVKNYFRVNKVLDAMQNKFGNAVNNADVADILPKEVFNNINAFRMASKITTPIKTAAKVLMGGAGKFLGVAPMVFGGMDYAEDPEAWMLKQYGVNPAPKGSLERGIQTGRIL